MLPEPSIFADLVRRKLDGPPPPGFDCGREMQSRYFYDRAWSEQQQQLSATYVYYLHGLAVAYATVCMDAVVLGTREKPAAIPYKRISALKLAQMGVDSRFQGLGLGSYIVAGMVEHAGEGAKRFGCRYLNLDAQPDLVPWYKRQGFTANKTMQRERIEAAAGRGDLAHIPVSMRFDLLDV